MKLTVTGRHAQVGAAFHDYALEKLERLVRLDEKVERVSLEFRVERNPRQESESDHIELTWISPRGVVRAEGSAAKPHPAFEAALERLTRQLRSAHDTRVIHHGRHTPATVRKEGAETPGSVPDESWTQRLEDELHALPEENAEV